MADETLRLIVVNSTGDYVSRDVSNAAGIGMKNVTRRLTLLYPDAHRLQVDQQDGTYSAVLELHLRRESEQETIPGNLSLTRHSQL